MPEEIIQETETEGVRKIETHIACSKLQDRVGDEVVEAVEAGDQWTVVCRPDRVLEILTFLRDEPGLAFDRLTDLTSVDFSE